MTWLPSISWFVSQTDSLNRFPLQKCQERYYGLEARVKALELDRREEKRAQAVIYRERARFAGSFEIYCPRYYPRAWERLADDWSHSRNVCLLGLRILLRLHVWCLPIAYLVVRMVHASAPDRMQQSDILQRSRRRATAQWHQALSMPPQTPNAQTAKAVSYHTETFSYDWGALRLIRPPSKVGWKGGVSGRGGEHAAGPRSLYLCQSNSGCDAPLRGAMGEWTQQIVSSLAALRFPQDLAQVRAAVKFGSRFDWLAKLSSRTSTKPFTADAVEALAVIPHDGHLLVANCGRCQAFLLTPDCLVPLNPAHQGTSPAETTRGSRLESLTRERQSSRALCPVDPEPCVRPEVSLVRREELCTGARIVATTSTLIEAMGAAAWQKVLWSSRHMAREELLDSLSKRAEQAGLQSSGAFFVYEPISSGAK